MRQISKKGNAERKVKFNLDDSAQRCETARLGIILYYGFGVAKGYSEVSRDRFVPELRGGKTFEQLRDFCQRHLKGSPIPGTDPIHEGPILLQLFKAAEMEGLVRLKFQKAERFLPEKGM